MTGMNYKREVLRSAAYNLRKARNGLLMHFVNLREDPLKGPCVAGITEIVT